MDLWNLVATEDSRAVQRFFVREERPLERTLDDIISPGHPRGHPAPVRGHSGPARESSRDAAAGKYKIFKLSPSGAVCIIPLYYYIDFFQAITRGPVGCGYNPSLLSCLTDRCPHTTIDHTHTAALLQMQITLHHTHLKIQCFPGGTFPGKNVAGSRTGCGTPRIH